MSFTAEVKDELSRLEDRDKSAQLAQLSALMRVCGTLSFRGSGRYSIRIATETGAVARTVIKMTHKLFDLDTALTVRRSVLHKTRNYLIEMPEQDELADALLELSILAPGHGLAAGVPTRLLGSRASRCAFVRGAFMAGGFIADPRGDFHLEIAVTGEEFAQGLVAVMGTLGVAARLNRRVNAEMANQARSTGAAVAQLELIDRAEKTVGLASLPPALRQFCQARRENPELSLVALGAELDPPASKSAVYHRVLRLQQLVEEAEGAQDPSATTQNASQSTGER